MHAPTPLVIALEKGLATWLGLDADSGKRLEALDGKLVALELLGLDMTLYFLGTGSTLSVRAFADETPDATIMATPLALAQLAIQDTADRALFEGQMKIDGDTEVAQTLQDILKGVDVDWEELLSGVVGDVVAHQVGRGIRGIMNWGRQSTDSLAEDLSEYLRHEADLLPEREDIQKFLDDVDTLRADIERFGMRLDRFEQQQNSQAG